MAQAARKRGGAGVVAKRLELAGNSADYETNPIVRQARHSAEFPPNFLKLALPSAGEAGAGAGFQGDSEASRNGDPSAGGVVEERRKLREIRQITKRTQSCAKRAGRRFCRRNSSDWLSRRPAKLE